MTNTFTDEHRIKLEQYLAEHELPSGLGTEESACSIAAINLALSGVLTDEIPDCMGEVLGRTTIILQDEMPDEMRNSSRYKKLLPDMAGTGREHEEERLTILQDWMRSVVLPKLQPLANEYGFGAEWRNMCQEKTSAAASAAAYAASAASAAASAAARAAARAAYAANAAYAADAAASAASAAAYAAADAARAAAYAAAARAAADAAYAADAAADAAYAADAARAAADAAAADFWNTVDPIGVLERMTYLKGETDA